ncbi:alkylhydroperoxidase AhpD family core domain-containing protein [Micromonospora nigra]|uniref:Alkylhydroperoxidase AhpD family core domain-containing protein n=1 Tax=Micromonospora nigra TaxID=145857 RepID=A0A1C6SY11_9ACTN|nr:carboxymuconolactone decarboxylase family protein [Micromonospora nigra]SCL34370.1 alkylhydroperoxidase AhpD family core domain-containing protein [Micromonospora nigra]
MDLIRRALRRPSQTHVRHLAPVAARTATGLVAAVYTQVEADFGMLAPPVALHAPAPEVLAAVWCMLRETTLADGVAPRADKEAVATAVSRINTCPYCVDVHGAALRGLRPGTDATALAEGRLADIAEPRLRALAGWATAPAGHPDGGPGHAPPFPPAHTAELTGVAVTFHYINRMVNVFLRDSPLPPLTGRARSTATGAAAWAMGRLARRALLPGRSARLLPDAAVPADLAWAAGSPHVAGAMARATASIETAGRRVVPAPVRALVTELVAGPPESTLDGRWVDVALARLPAADHAVGRLALLTAVASYRVTDAVVAAARTDGFGDRELVEATAWASLTAARRVGTGATAGPAPRPGTGSADATSGPGPTTPSGDQASR